MLVNKKLKSLKHGKHKGLHGKNKGGNRLNGVIAQVMNNVLKIILKIEIFTRRFHAKTQKEQRTQRILDRSGF
jgi:hypothetical protein